MYGMRVHSAAPGHTRQLAFVPGQSLLNNMVLMCYLLVRAGAVESLTPLPSVAASSGLSAATCERCHSPAATAAATAGGAPVAVLVGAMVHQHQPQQQQQGHAGKGGDGPGCPGGRTLELLLLRETQHERSQRLHGRDGGNSKSWELQRLWAISDTLLLLPVHHPYAFCAALVPSSTPAAAGTVSTAPVGSAQGCTSDCSQEAAPPPQPQQQQRHQTALLATVGAVVVLGPSSVCRSTHGTRAQQQRPTSGAYSVGGGGMDWHRPQQDVDDPCQAPYGYGVGEGEDEDAVAYGRSGGQPSLPAPPDGCMPVTAAAAPEVEALGPVQLPWGPWGVRPAVLLPSSVSDRTGLGTRQHHGGRGCRLTDMLGGEVTLLVIAWCPSPHRQGPSHGAVPSLSLPCSRWVHCRLTSCCTWRPRGHLRPQRRQGHQGPAGCAATASCRMRVAATQEDCMPAGRCRRRRIAAELSVASGVWPLATADGDCIRSMVGPRPLRLMRSWRRRCRTRHTSRRRGGRPAGTRRRGQQQEGQRERRATVRSRSGSTPGGWRKCWRTWPGAGTQVGRRWRAGCMGCTCGCSVGRAGGAHVQRHQLANVRTGACWCPCFTPYSYATALHCYGYMSAPAGVWHAMERRAALQRMMALTRQAERQLSDLAALGGAGSGGGAGSWLGATTPAMALPSPGALCPPLGPLPVSALPATAVPPGIHGCSGQLPQPQSLDVDVKSAAQWVEGEHWHAKVGHHVRGVAMIGIESGTRPSAPRHAASLPTLLGGQGPSGGDH